MYNFTERLNQLREIGVTDISIAGGPLRNELEMPPAQNIDVQSGFFQALWLNCPAKFFLKVKAKRENNFIVFQTTGSKKTIQQLYDMNLGLGHECCFVRTVKTSLDKNSGQTTKNNSYETNGLWVAHIDENDRLAMWEISITTNISDGVSAYYLSIQKVYSAQIYRFWGEANSIHRIWISPNEFPGFEKWESLRPTLEEWLWSNGNYYDLPRLPENDSPVFNPLPSLDVSDLKNGQARVIFYSQSRRYGLCILPGKEKPAIIHASEIQDEMPALDCEQIVRYQNIRPTINGLELLRVSEINN